MNEIIPVILCGGSGTRLWPLSREHYPKPFVDLGGGRTLFEDTLTRARAVPDCGAPYIVCNESHRFFVTSALRNLFPDANVILEPEPRNTAPAIALAAHAIRDKGDGLMLIMPSDHVMADYEAFNECVGHAAILAGQGYITVLGIVPTIPETGFGYIEQGEALAANGFLVKRFVEKPQLRYAAAMLEHGGYFWNSGIFLMRASVYLDDLERYAPAIHTVCDKAWKTHTRDGIFIRPDTKTFLTSPSDSIDYAVMEHTTKAAMTLLGAQWSDFGSWEAIYQFGPFDAHGNVCQGDIFIAGSERCYCNARHRLLAAIGVHDLAIIETQDAVLVATREHVQEVKDIVARLKDARRDECVHPPKVYRPWGSYETLIKESRFQVKKITVNPGAELSLQMHHHRAEHWVVVSGTAEVTNGDTVQLFTENQSTYIPVGRRHRLKNPGHIPLVLIEIQSGAYLGEDDIVRFEDMYGRVLTN